VIVFDIVGQIDGHIQETFSLHRRHMGFDGTLVDLGWANDRVAVAAKWVHATKAAYPPALEKELLD